MAATMQSARWRRNAETAVLPIITRDRIASAAREVMRAALYHRPLRSVTARTRESWMELGAPLAALGQIVDEWPETAELFCAWLRGRAMAEPAELADCIDALVDCDAEEEKARAKYLQNPTDANGRAWAAALRLQAARSIETARVLEDNHREN